MTAEEFVKLCREPDDDPLETLRESLADHPEYANASGQNGVTALESCFLAYTTDQNDDPAPRVKVLLGIAKLLLEHGADPQNRFRDGKTPLQASVGANPGDDGLIQLLLIHGADPNAKLGHVLHGNTILVDACCRGRTKVVLLLIQYGADVNANHGGKYTPLMGSIHNGHTGVVELLIQHGANVNTCTIHSISENEYGIHKRTPLLLAFKISRNTEIVKLLLKNGANPNAKYKRDCDCTAFPEACCTATLEQLKLLVKHGADVNAYCKCDNHSALSVLICHQHWDAVYFMLEQGADPSLQVATLDTDTSCLMSAVERGGDQKMLAALLEKGAPINEVTCRGESAVGLAATIRRDVSLVQFLIENGANVNARATDDNNNTTPSPWLHFVSSDDATVEMARLFLEAGGAEAVNDSDQEGNSPLMLARLVSTVKFLLDHATTTTAINAVNKEGDTALIRHARDLRGSRPRTSRRFSYPSMEIVKELLTVDNVDKNATNHQGETALIIASRQGRLDVVQLLLNSIDGVAVNKADLNGQSALLQTVAVQKDYREIIDALLQHGADVNMKDSLGNTPLMVACREHGDDGLGLVELLVSRGASVNQENNGGHTALFLANEKEALSTVNFLLHNGALTMLKREPEYPGRV